MGIFLRFLTVPNIKGVLGFRGFGSEGLVVLGIRVSGLGDYDKGNSNPHKGLLV